MHLFEKFVLTLLALIAFAGNSVLCRWALAEYQLDPATFTLLRLVSGALTLAVILWLSQRRQQPAQTRAGQQHPVSWWGALWLVCYAAAFAYAYVELATGIGALVLFSAVQFSMLLISAVRGERFSLLQILGIATALIGFCYLVWPQWSQPVSLTALMMMLLAGAAWGAYSTIGRGSRTPLADTLIHFRRASMLALPLLFWVNWQVQPAYEAVMLALMSGALTSAVGYAIWFKVLPQLQVTSAAVGQLSVPIIAAIGGIIFVGEPLEQRFVIASSVILVSIFVVTRSRINKNKT
ncbi:DMT family transporter [Pseudidiomarina sp. 1APR75-33.1]|uniref:DMT family transporter n=1 Tax=Pseudidiomarina terrestris TaxID=2820060 RepID=UPI002651AABB|nr:DMT family transporter [Pseudidiomarina sp. 1APR75-33.1]MDN7127136.1 DMT family transporter [Pseudidiomarina sp. 1APR75-33.1]